MKSLSKMLFRLKEGILKINELSNKRIGILLNNSFLVYNLNNFKKLYEIKLPIISQGYCDDKGIFDFIELKNSDLVLWSTEKIFLYQLLENEYKLYQEIDKFETGENEVFKNDFFFRSAHKKFSINSIYELTNGKLIPITWQKDSRSSKSKYLDAFNVIIFPSSIFSIILSCI